MWQQTECTRSFFDFVIFFEIYSLVLGPCLSAIACRKVIEIVLLTKRYLSSDLEYRVDGD
jgi:hypothetical protein